LNFGEVHLKRTAGPVVATNEERIAAEAKVEAQATEARDTINKHVREADIEEWYEALKDVTYETIYCPITLDEGQAMVDVYENNELGKETPGHLQAKIAAMTTKLQATMDKFADGAFVKLSSRSAKDSAVSSDRTKRIFIELLANVEKPTLNDKLAAINRAHILALQLKDAKEVITMFLSSERINSDLKLALEYPNNWTQDFVVRKFVGIPIEYEFRGFVVNNILRAMCQYYHWIYFPTLVENKEKLNSIILKKFEEVKDRVPIDTKTYVVDWAVDLKNEQVYIIEINPFGDYEGMGTSPAMFQLHINDGKMDRQGADRHLFFWGWCL